MADFYMQYQSFFGIFSDGEYCGRCGENLGGGCLNKDDFQCNGWEGQRQCDVYCRDRPTVLNVPGFCWTYTWCFHSCCNDNQKASMELRNL
jgi:hypothetical protein